MKTLVVINGVTGAIGTACLAQFTRQENVTIIGLSRQGEPVSSFAKNGYLPDNTLICSIGDIRKQDDCKKFVKAINVSLYERIIYVHGVGVYPFEINKKGEVEVTHDVNGDGIDDRVVDLSYTAFFAMTNALIATKKKVHAVIFGGIADEHKPAVHTSWWTVMERVKRTMKEIAANKKNIYFFVLNISSVICPHEILTRPYVFQSTDADPRFWLMPHEVAQEVASLTSSDTKNGFTQKDLFHPSNYYHKEYFKDIHFTERKKKELGIL